MGVGGQRHTPAALPPGKTWCPLYRRQGGSQGWSGWVRKISPPLGFAPQTVKPVGSCCTDWAIPAPSIDCSYLNIRWSCVEDNPASQASISKKISVWNVLAFVCDYRATPITQVINEKKKKGIWVNMVFNSAKTFQVQSWHFCCVAGALSILCNFTFFIDRLEVEFEAFTVTEYFDIFLGYLPCHCGSAGIHKRKC